MIAFTRCTDAKPEMGAKVAEAAKVFAVSFVYPSFLLASKLVYQDACFQLLDLLLLAFFAIFILPCSFFPFDKSLLSCSPGHFTDPFLLSLPGAD